VASERQSWLSSQRTAHHENSGERNGGGGISWRSPAAWRSGVQLATRQAAKPAAMARIAEMVTIVAGGWL